MIILSFQCIINILVLIEIISSSLLINLHEIKIEPENIKNNQ